jgi:hypothetical protein
MANHIVTLTKADGMFVADTMSVPVVNGDTLTIGTDDGSAFALFFSPAAEAIVSPKPESSFVAPKGTKAIFTFTSSKAGAYTVFYGPIGSDQPGSFSTDSSTNLYLNPVSVAGVGFGGPGGNENMTTGH